MTELQIRADYYQYYVDGGEDFDESSVDYLTDGLIAPRGCRARINTEFRSGTVPVEVRVQDGPLRLPEDPGVQAAACSLRVTDGVFAIRGWGEAASFEHSFGTDELICSILIERRTDPEAHIITISDQPMTPTRWRSAALAEKYPTVPPGWPETPDLEPHEEDDDDRTVASFRALATEPVLPSTPLTPDEFDAAIWGGRPPSAALLAVGDIAAGLADVNRDFAEALAAAPASVQRQIAREYARRDELAVAEHPDPGHAVFAVLYSTEVRNGTARRLDQVAARITAKYLEPTEQS